MDTATFDEMERTTPLEAPTDPRRFASPDFDEIERTLSTHGPEAALRRLCDLLRDHKDYGGLFYALLMEKRHQLGVSPVPTGPASDLPESAHEPFEDAIRHAGRLVGNLYLQEKNLPQAWAYFRMLGEPEPIRAALEAYQPTEDEDVQNLVQIAYYEGVNPTRGFDWVLGRFGLCSAITTLGSQGLPQDPAVRQHCLQVLVRALYSELRERLTVAITQQEEKAPAEASAPSDTPGIVRKLIQGRDRLFDEDAYFIDVSHLSSVVQMSVNLEPCPELGLARELCEYGQRLSDKLKGISDPPFEDQYTAYDHYLGIVSGESVEKGLDYFRAQADNSDPETVGTYPAQVLVNLLLRLGRKQEALAAARKYHLGADGQQLSCPGVKELCQQLQDFRTLAEVAREQNDPVHFLAGLLGARK